MLEVSEENKKLTSISHSIAMSSVAVCGVDIRFPFPPYSAQVEYVEALVKCLDGRLNGLLESPTGTGKTLCLLCGALGWARANAPAPSVIQRQVSGEVRGTPKVIYCSRTHAQLSQVVRELKKTEYASSISMALLASREHMCVHSQVKQLPSQLAQQSMCSMLRADRNCRFYRRLQSSRDAELLSCDVKIHDMEDLVTDARKSGFCPYYFEREAAKEADLVLMPYNYALDPAVRKQLPFSLKDSILIVDEAHNLPSVLSAAGCLNLSPLDIAHAMSDCTRAAAMVRHHLSRDGASELGSAGKREQELAALKILLAGLEQHITEFTEDPEGKSSTENPVEVVRPGTYMLEFLAKAHISRSLFDPCGSAGESISDVMSGCIAILADSERPASGVGAVQEFLTAVFSCEADNITAARFVLQKKKTERSSSRTLSFWMLDNSLAMRDLSETVHSLILTSGTLSPLDLFAAELGIEFEVRLQGSHVIHDGQVGGAVMCRGPNGEKLNGAFNFRSSIHYRYGLGMSLVNLCRNTPGGTLVFFPSYTAMNAALDLWRSGTGEGSDQKTIWGLITTLKPVFVEPSDSAQLTTVVQAFQKEVDASPSKGAVLLAVCRGKISEGVDFSDNHGRCVVVTGIPYANHTDLFVRLKREYITCTASQRPLVNGRPFTGDDWYVNEAMRAVNQCVGRVIRHKDDYGFVVLADERFEPLLTHVSGWARRQLKVEKEFRGAFNALSQFFVNRRPVRSAPNHSLYIVVEGDADEPYVDTVPETAELARSFARTEKIRASEGEQARQRRRLEELHSGRPVSGGGHIGVDEKANEADSRAGTAVKKRPLPAAAVTDLGCLKMVRQVVADPISTTTMLQFPQAASPGPPPDVGNSPTEFCTFLKQRVSSALYDGFKDLLKQMVGLRAVVRRSPAQARGDGASLVRRLIHIFKCADAVHWIYISHQFARHIPPELRALYADLLEENQEVTQ